MPGEKTAYVPGRGLIPSAKSIKSKWASQAAEKLIRAVGRGFIPGTKSMESTSALAAEVSFLHVSPQIPGFSAASQGPPFVVLSIQ